jgi:hypothetical protein
MASSATTSLPVQRRTRRLPQTAPGEEREHGRFAGGLQSGGCERPGRKRNDCLTIHPEAQRFEDSEDIQAAVFVSNGSAATPAADRSPPNG